MKYSPSTGGFYLPQIHGANIPADAIDITTETHTALLAGQSSGQRIVPGAGGLPVLQPPPPPSEAQVIAAFERAVQAHMDAAAKAAGYDDIKTAVTYAEEPAVIKFQQEARAFRAWRSICWSYCYAQLAAVQAGTRAQPTIPAFIAELPALDLPA